VKAEPEGFKFTDELVLPASSVKNQHRTGTCWSFSGLSFFESEMLRLNKPETDLSEMFVVYHAYSEKAGKYMRMQGNTNFGGGGAFHDVSNVIRQYGIVPEEVFKGLNYGEDKHVHGELDALLKEQMVALVKNPNRKISPVWHETIVSTLNTYLGALPERFEYKGKNYTPQSFAREVVGLNMDDYVEITSFTHHPFYTSFILEVPDNWSWDKVYNVPLAEMEEIIDYSLQNGFTVAWATDVSEKGFLSSNRGVAMVPVKRTEEMTNAEILRWEKLSDREKEDETYRITKPGPELEITQELRQVDFDSQQTTDDHGMHIVGLARDQTGKTFYKVKNSWGDYNLYDGYFYASKAYVNYKTTSIMVHKDAIPAPIRTKLGL
jgi:bleomycin hydrolase